MRRVARVVAVLVAVVACVAVAAAQSAPAPVTLVVPFPAGGADDLLGRLVASGLSERLGRPVVVENLGAAAHLAGVARIGNATPDGSRLLLGSAATHAMSQSLYRTKPFDAVTDFVL
jgi:tripartite-type tricarboxylate transporter receptor subunit TctC